MLDMQGFLKMRNFQAAGGYLPFGFHQAMRNNGPNDFMPAVE